MYELYNSYVQMEEYSATDARQNLPEIVSEVAYSKKRVVITRRGKPLVVVIPYEELEALDLLEKLRSPGGKPGSSSR